jgi:hypothetical protein
MILVGIDCSRVKVATISRKVRVGKLLRTSLLGTQPLFTLRLESAYVAIGQYERQDLQCCGLAYFV